jgi:hypothetical protein
VRQYTLKVEDDVEAIVETYCARDPEMTYNRLFREAVRRMAKEDGIEVPAPCPA